MSAKKSKAKPRGGEHKRTQGRPPIAAPDWSPAFLEALRREGTIYQACQKAGVGRTTVYERRRTDKTFAADFDMAVEEATDNLEREAIRRGAEGYLDPIIHQGRLMGDWYRPDGTPCGPGDPGAAFVPLCVRRYSDQLLANLLKWRRYHDRTVSGDGEQQPIAFILVPVPYDASRPLTFIDSTNQVDAAQSTAVDRDRGEGRQAGDQAESSPRPAEGMG